ncbi:hypothetical protein FRB95_003189 [Tulasnella sp. JGI-2019a]|nr:hypothetical protein FRB93_005060 [Tulasnella sp. JGI-2019a]KAG9031078.1 hypothetical protein FRB95_003189 [Tulasnella sp. JGI-2019a]
MHHQLQGRRRRHQVLRDQNQGPIESTDIDDVRGQYDNAVDDIPPAVTYQEMRELRKLRYILRRRRKAAPDTMWQKFLRWFLYPMAEDSLTAFCLWLPNVYKERHRKLAYAVLEPDTWPHMFTDRRARKRAATAWKSYANSLVDEWNSANVITALILSAAGSFLAIPDINLTSKYCLLFTLLSSLASLAHATYHSHFYRSLIDDEHYTLLQLRCYLSCYRPIMGFLLCMPLLDLLYAIAAFSIAIIAYLWPYEAPSDVSNPPPLWQPPLLAKVTIPGIYVLQLGTIALSYKWNRSAFFTTNELLVGEDGRRAQVIEDEEKRAEELLLEMERDQTVADTVPIFDANAPQGVFDSNIPKLPAYYRAPPTGSSSRVISTEGKALASAGDDLPETTHVDRGPVRWITNSMSHIPDDAMPLGYENPKERDQLYACRVFYEGRWRLGKVGRQSLASIPYRGKEVVVMMNYDVLCGDPSHFAWLSIPKGASFIANAATAIPDGFKLMSVDGTHSGSNQMVYAATGNVKGGRHLGEVLDGATMASIPFWRQELEVSPFMVLLVKKGAEESTVDD